jgi:hypothetical protein
MPCLLIPVKLALLPTPPVDANMPLLPWAAALAMLLALLLPLLPRAAAAATLLLAARLGGFL